MSYSFDLSWQRLAIAGDAQAIAALGRHMLRPVYQFCFYRVGGDHHLCEDAVQETMLRAIRKLRKYEPNRAGNNIFPWLTGLARNEIRRLLTQKIPGQSLDDLWARMDRDLLAIYARLEQDPFDDDVIQQRETQMMVNATMAQLPLTYRETLEAKYVDGASVRDIAVRLSLSEKAIESRLSRARVAFRETFLALTRNLSQT